MSQKSVPPAVPFGRCLDLGHGRRQLLVERLRQPEGEQPGSGGEDAEDDGRDAGVDLAVKGGKTGLYRHRGFLTFPRRSTMYGADMEPIRAKVEAAPTATFLTAVGNNSAV